MSENNNTKKSRKKIIICVVFAIITISILAFFLIPAKFLKNVNPDDVSCITVFDGNTGKGFDITDRDDISRIVNNIKETTLYRKKISLGYMGYGFRMKFKDSKGQIIKELILNSEDSIRKDPFFYSSKDSNLDFEFIKSLVPLQGN